MVNSPNWRRNWGLRSLKLKLRAYPSLPGKKHQRQTLIEILELLHVKGSYADQGASKPALDPPGGDRSGVEVSLSQLLEGSLFEFCFSEQFRQRKVLLLQGFQFPRFLGFQAAVMVPPPEYVASVKLSSFNTAATPPPSARI